MRLALAMGRPDVDAMLREISAAQFKEWQAYAGLEPFGEERADLRNGILCSLVASFGNRPGGTRPKPADFMPQFGPKPAKDWRIQKAAAKVVLLAHNKRLERARSGGSVSAPQPT